ncbi:unnamed protein product [Paramecium primaurelia]|uniref:Uncharacterized protein n=1 Tax=Paramecium primaurelia TaxID=5886 RepID=A0A8S1QCK5_PARPR|nr:unnamed protein product [Paramecium primaurelia]CAD8112150.1 unnamed protein product [Paramecium primaurelia]
MKLNYFIDLSNHNKKIQLQVKNDQYQIKKIIDNQEHWFEEILEYYEEIVYEYNENDLNELNLQSQMDLYYLIQDNDIPEDCQEEIISLYEYYDTNDQTFNDLLDNQQTENKVNFDVQNFEEEESQLYDHEESLENDNLIKEKTINADNKQCSQGYNKQMKIKYINRTKIQKNNVKQQKKLKQK